MFELLTLFFAIFVIVRLSNQTEQIRALQAEVSSVQRRLGPFFPETETQTRRSAPQTPPSSAPGPAPKAKPVPKESHSPVARPAPSFTPRAREERQEPLFDRLSAQTRQEWEALVGERLLNRVGAIALIIASGLFLKYAFDRNWISPTVRVLIGGIFGASLILAASRQRERLPVFAQGLLGTGVSVLYLSVYASFAFYRLIPVAVAFALMSVVTAAAFERAVRFDSTGVGLLGWAGGYLTPLLLSNPVSGAPGSDDPGALFMYLVLLQAGLLGLAVWRPQRWRVLEALTLGGTYFVFLLWQVPSYRPEHFGVAMTFLVVAWGMFVAVDLKRTWRGEEDEDESAAALRFINGAAFYAFLTVMVRSRFPESLPEITFLVAIAYASPIFVFRRSLPAYALKAIVLTAIATFLGFRDFTVPVLWALEGLALLGLGLRMRLHHIRLAAHGLFGLGTFGLLLVPGALAFQSLEGYRPVVNERFASFAVITAALAGGAYLLKRFGDHEFEEGPVFGPQESEHEWAVPALQYAWAGLLFGLLSVEINDFFRWRSGGRLGGSLGFLRLLSLAAVWAGYSFFLIQQGARRGSSALIQVGAGICLLATSVVLVRGAIFEPLSEFQPVLNVRVAIMLWTIGVLFFASKALAASDEEWAVPGAAWIRVAAASIMFVLLTGEIRDSFRRVMSTANPAEFERLGSQLQLALSGGWLLYASVALSLGFWLRKPGMRIAAIGLLGLTILKVFLFDLSFLEELYRIFSFMALGIILMAASYLYQRYREAIFGAG